MWLLQGSIKARTKAPLALMWVELASKWVRFSLFDSVWTAFIQSDFHCSSGRDDKTLVGDKSEVE